MVSYGSTIGMYGVPMMISRIALGLLLGFALLSPAMAAEPAFLSKHGDWTAHVGVEAGRKTCFAWSNPAKSKGNYSTRGEVVAYITIYNPSPQGDDYYDGGQISIAAGYKYKKDGKVVASIGNHKFELLNHTKQRTAGPNQCRCGRRHRDVRSPDQPGTVRQSAADTGRRQ